MPGLQIFWRIPFFMHPSRVEFRPDRPGLSLPSLLAMVMGIEGRKIHHSYEVMMHDMKGSEVIC